MSKKKKLIITICIAFGIALIGSIISVVIMVNNQNETAGGYDASDEYVNEDDIIDTTVEDFKDNLETDNAISILNNCSKLTEHYQLSDYDFVDGVNFEEGWRITSGKRVEGKGDSESEEFECTISEGINESPDIALTFTTSSMSEAEVESLAYEVLSELSNDDMVGLMRELPYNSLDMTEVEDKAFENITFTKDKIETDPPEYKFENGELIEVDDDKIYTYIYGVKYIANEDKIVREFTQGEFDKKIYLGIPIFSESGISNINDPMMLMPWITAQDISDINLTSYGYTAGSEIDSCEMSILSVANSGETLSTNFSIKYSNDTNLVNYSFTTMTGYRETFDDAFDAAIKLINSITGLETTKDSYSSTSEKNQYQEQSFILFDAPDEGEDISEEDIENLGDIISIDIKYEPDLGFYGYIMAA